MTKLINRCMSLALFLFVLRVEAQPVQYPIGRCIDQVNQIAFDVTPDFHIWNINNPQHNMQAFRDPAGMYFLRLPAAQPWREAFFISWQSQLVSLNVDSAAPIVLGSCTFVSGAIGQPVAVPQFDTRLSQNRGVLNTDGRLLRTPQFIPVDHPSLAIPGMTSPKSAEMCLQKSGLDKEKFADCMIPKMLTPAQRRAYACTQQAEGDNIMMSACLAKQLVGANEARAIDQATKCYQDHGDDFEKYPLCMARQNFDEKTAATINCFTDHAREGDVSPWSTAACAAGTQLGLNPELTIAVECAVQSGGEPYTFVGCSAGRLTTRELDKCMTHGIGGEDGCFGPNNEIVKGLRLFGIDVGNLTNPNGAVINAINTVSNDLQHGPGPNNDVVRAVQTINNDLRNGLGENNDIRKVANQLGLGGLF